MRDVWMNLNDQAVIMIQTETLEGINNLDAILTEVPDIDVVWLGSWFGSLDCRINMNLPANFGQGGEPKWLAARPSPSLMPRSSTTSRAPASARRAVRG